MPQFQVEEKGKRDRRYWKRRRMARSRRKHFCQYYTRGKCKNGKDCRYVHDEAKTEFELKQARLSMSAIELEEEARSKKAKRTAVSP